MGPTASGKTDLSIALSKTFPVEIINVDSAQIYQGMDIGSGKADTAIREKIPHYLIDFLDPKIPYSAAQFKEDALECIKDILNRDRVPVLVGGTMLYFKALQNGLSQLPKSDPDIRRQLEIILESRGLNALFQHLQEIDPLSAKRLKSTDTQRIMRALEVYKITNKPLSYWFEQPMDSMESQLPCRFLNIALAPITTNRMILHQRIETRFDNMLKQGLVSEVQMLLQQGIDPSLPSMRCVGYRQVYEYLTNKISYGQMREKAIIATRQLAKRQLTWLRQWPSLKMFDFLCPKLNCQIMDWLYTQGLNN